MGTLVISSGCNTLIPFQQLLEGPVGVLLCERVNDWDYFSIFHSGQVKSARGRFDFF